MSQTLESRKRNIRLAAFDLDDTLLDGTGRLTEETKAAISFAAQNGIEPVIASGRSFYSIPDYIRDVPGIRYAICSNGANVFNTITKECISSYFLSESSVEQIIRLADDYGDTIYLDAFTRGIPHTDKRMLDTLLSNEKISEHRKEYLRKTRVPETDIRGFIRTHADQLDCMNYNVFETSLFDELMGRLAKEVSGIYVTSSLPQLIEISDQRSGKAGGLRRICELLSVPIEEAAAFGNAHNDADMIKLAGIGYAVSNSDRVALDAADCVIGANTEDAVAAELRSLVALKSM